MAISLFSIKHISLWLTELADDKDRTFLSDGITSFKLMPTDIKFTQAEMENYRSATNPAPQTQSGGHNQARNCSGQLPNNSSKAHCDQHIRSYS